jgi:hypothetical protein
MRERILTILTQNYGLITYPENLTTLDDSQLLHIYDSLLSYISKVTPEDSITICTKRYNSLLDKAFKLSCLENGGVDNWEGYDYSMTEYWDAKAEEDEDDV